MAVKVGTLLVEVAANVATIQRDMGKASQVVTRAQRQIQSAARWISGSLAAAFTVAGIKAWIGGVIDAGDATAKMAQKVGLAVSDLSTLQHAAKLSGVSVESLKVGLAQFSKSAEAQSKGTKKALMDLADEFAAMPDGAQKSKRAMELLGRSGVDMIPLLNAGSAGIAAMQDEARKLGIELDDVSAKSMEAFNDEITRLKAASDGLAITWAKALTPGATTLMKIMTEGAKSGNLLSAALRAVGSSLSDAAMKQAEADIGGPLEKLVVLQDRIKEIRRQLESSEGADTSFLFGAKFSDIREQLNRELLELVELEDMYRLEIANDTKRDTESAAKKAASNRAQLLQRQYDDEYDAAKKRLEARAKLVEEEMAMEKKATEEMAREEDKRLRDFEEQTRWKADAAREALAEMERAEKASFDRAKSRARSLAQDMSEAFAEMALTGKADVRSMVNSWIGDWIKAWSYKQLFAPLMMGLTGTSAASHAPSTLPGTPTSGPVMAAKGAVLTRPTLLAGGAALAGEAGTEGVLPLARTRNGDLGVQAVGGGGVSVTVIDQRRSGEAIRPEVSNTGTGREIRLVVRDAVRADLADGSLDRDLSMAYGLRRAGTRR